MPSLVPFTLRRLLRGLLTVWFAVTVTFLLLRLLPGNPALAIANPNMTEGMRAQLLQQYGLDQPLPVQYGKYMWQLVQGNLGISFTQSTPVSSVLMERLPWTLLLTGTALLLTVVIGIPLGVVAATHPRGARPARPDRRGHRPVPVRPEHRHLPQIEERDLWLSVVREFLREALTSAGTI